MKQNWKPVRGRDLARWTGLLLIAVVVVMTGQVGAAPLAAANDTDGSGGQGTGGGGDGCALGGWRVVDSLNDMVWQDDGAGAASCSNSAYAKRNGAEHQDITWTRPGGEVFRCRVADTSTQAQNRNCYNHNGYKVKRSNAPLYRELTNMDTNACYRRNDIHAVWYLEDADSTPSWSNYGTTPSPRATGSNSQAYRNVHDLKSAILQDNNSNGVATIKNRQTQAWWLERIERWMEPDLYATLKSSPMTNAEIVDWAQGYIASTVKDEAGNSPVIFCWYQGLPNTMTCNDLPDWNHWISAEGMTGASSPNNLNNCYLKCPAGSKKAGKTIAKTVVTGVPASDTRTRQQKLNDHCWPPDSFDLTEYGWSSEIWNSMRQDGSFGGPGVYAWITSVNDATPEVKGQLKWIADGAPAPVTSKKTKFGEFWDTYCSDPSGCAIPRSSGTCVDFNTKYKAAINADATSKHADVNLSAHHKEALAQGRTLTVLEQEFNSEAWCGQETDQYWSRRCQGATYYNWDGTVNSGRSTNSCPMTGSGTGPTNPGVWRLANLGTHPERPYRWGSTAARSMPRTSQAYQVLTNRCNYHDVDSVVTNHDTVGNNTLGGKVYTGDGSGYFGSANVSANYSGAQLAGGTAVLPWGVESNNKTNSAGFYNKLCSFDGKLSDPLTFREESYTPRSEWTFFRDNLDHVNENMPFYTPINTNPMINYSRTAPTQTIISRDPDGTPSDIQSNMKALGCGPSSTTKSNPIFGTEGEAPELAQFVREDFATKNVGAAEGCYSRVTSNATFASSAQKPQVFSVWWRFSPDSYYDAPSESLGWGGTSGSATWTAARVSAPLDGLVQAKNHGGAESNPSSYDRQNSKQKTWNATGSGAVNTLTVPLPDGTDKRLDTGAWGTKPTAYSDAYFMVRYVRAVAE